jgi:tetratricopeptide (TPR) repeat protein
MTTLTVETRSMPAADLGPENPLPPLNNQRDLHEITDLPGIPEDMLRNMSYGHVPNILPYTVQDGYTRHRVPKDFKVIVLENDILRAEFLIDYGGRLWSLFHKPANRELLTVNPVFQPANLALRNAWFSGGVEWNIGTIGHTPFTCSPLFAAKVIGEDNLPVLRMYEWERIRQVAYQIDAYLPDNSPMLFIRIRIINPHDHEIPMYWWSNIAVPETPDTRVLVPTNSTYKFGYQRDLTEIPIPAFEGTDHSYSTSCRRSVDYFFNLKDGQQPWITTLDGTGAGLIQVSTDRLRGRKLFLWGVGSGGQRWQNFLSEPGEPYIEVQAGLARTQLEHLPMPAQTEWSWLEGYGLMQADPDLVHGDDWQQATKHINNNLGEILSRNDFEAEYKRGQQWQDTPPSQILHRGSGWGYLEQHRREAMNNPAFCSTGLVFDAETVGDAQRPWLSLLEGGALPDVFDGQSPAFMVQDEWRTLLQQSIDQGTSDNSASWLHLGAMHYYAGDYVAARHAWEKSLEHTQSPWALRNLAVLDRVNGQFDKAAESYRKAYQLSPTLRPLLVELGQTLIDAGCAQEWLDIADDLPHPLSTNGRVRLLIAQAALAVRDYPRVQQFFDQQVVIDDLREGEVSLTNLWFDFHEQRLSDEENCPINEALSQRVRDQYPLPEHADFRMLDT